MKRSMTFAALIVACLLMSQSLFAQLPVGFSTGVKGGLTFATLRGDTDDFGDLSYRQGFSAGVFARVNMLGLLAVQPEVNFVQKGAEAKAEETFLGQTFSVEQKANLNYIEIPVLLHFNAPVVPTLLDLSFYGGPAVGFKISESTTTTVNGVEEEDDSDEDSFKSNDFGLVLGGGVNLSSPGLPTIMLDIRYVLGLSNVLDNDPDALEDLSIKNGAITATLGLGL